MERIWVKVARWSRYSYLRVVRIKAPAESIALGLALGGKFALLAAQPAALLPAILLAGHTLSGACAASLLPALDY